MGKIDVGFKMVDMICVEGIQLLKKCTFLFVPYCHLCDSYIHISHYTTNME